MSFKRAVVFSGGGAKGSYQIGAWKALRELNFKPDIVTGTSVGALNGALMALDRYEEALSIWENMSMDSVFSQFVEKSVDENNERGESHNLRLIKEILTKGGADYAPLKNLVKSLMDEEKLRKSKTKFGLVTTTFPNIKPVQMFIDDIPEGEVADYVIASAAAFPFLKSHKIGEIKFVDGAYSDNMPIQMAISKGATEIVAVNVGRMSCPKFDCTNISIQYIQGKRPYNKGKLGSFVYFNKELAINNIQQGYLDTLKSFGKFDGYYYAFEKFEKYKVTPFERHCAKKFDLVFSDIPNVTRFERIGRDSVLSLLRKYEDKPFEFNSNILFCAEIAAEVLSINPRVVYTMKSMSNEILDEAKKLLEDKEKESKLDNLIATLDKGVSLDLFKSIIDVKDKRLLTCYAMRLLAMDNLAQKERRRLWLISSLSPESFCAALFCNAVLTVENANKFI